MNIARLAVHRPVATCVVFLVILIFGGMSFSKLAIDLLPDLAFPTMSIRVGYEGVAPEEIERLITIPIEEAVSTVPSVEEITGSSSEGNALVRVSFTWGTNLDTALNDLRSALDRARDILPEDATEPRIFRFDPSLFPILFYGIESPMPSKQLRLLAETTLKNRLSRVEGVGAVQAHGGERREIQIELDTQKLTALGMPLERVARALASQNRNTPGGNIEQGLEDVLYRSTGEFEDLMDLRSTVVEMRGETPLYIEDLGRVRDGVKEEKRHVRINGRPAVMVAITKRSGANTSQVARAVRAEVERIHRDMPGIRLIPIFDQSRFIEQAIGNVSQAALVGALFAVAVLYLFLRSVAATVVVAVTIPISVVATFILMYGAGYTLNLISFGGLALGIGMLVDNAIVILENIFRHRERGAGPRKAAVEGTGEVAAAVTASTLTTLSVFMPLLFIEGVAGVLFHQMAMVVTYSLACSLLVAMTLTPLMASWMAHIPSATEGGMRDRLDRGYGWLLSLSLRHPMTVFVVASLLVGVALGLAPRLGREFLPTTDEGDLRISLEAAVGTRIGVVDAAEREVEQVLEQNVPEMDTRFASIGGRLFGGSQNTHVAQVRVKLVPRAERTRSDRDVAASLRELLKDIPGVRTFVSTVSGLFIFRRLARGGDNLIVEVRGHDPEDAMQVAREVEAAMKATPGLTRPGLSREVGRPETTVRVDREKAAWHGLSPRTVAETLQDHMAGRVATRFRQEGQEHDIRVRLRLSDRDSLEDLRSIPVSTPGGTLVPLGDLVTFRRAQGPITLERRDQERIIEVSASTQGRPLNRILDDLEPKLRAIPLPAGISLVFAGDVEEQGKAFRQLLLGLVLAVVLVYLVMAAQFENLLAPLLIMFSMPFAIIGVVGLLLPTGTTLNVQSFLGLIVLAGIVVNNAIVLVDYTGQLRAHQGMALREAVLQGARARLRPILMTTLTTILALMPIAIGAGEGGEVQASLGRVLIGGLLTSSLITLVFIPVLYDVVGIAVKADEESRE